MAKLSISAGPAPSRPSARLPAAAVPMVLKMPAPMMAPIPDMVRWNAPRFLFRGFSAPSLLARSCSRDLVRRRLFSISDPMNEAPGRREGGVILRPGGLRALPLHQRQQHGPQLLLLRRGEGL